MMLSCFVHGCLVVALILCSFIAVYSLSRVADLRRSNQRLVHLLSPTREGGGFLSFLIGLRILILIPDGLQSRRDGELPRPPTFGVCHCLASVQTHAAEVDGRCTPLGRIITFANLVSFVSSGS